MATNWHLDDGYHLDQKYGEELVHEVELTMDVTYIAHPLTGIELVMIGELDTSPIQTVGLDLLPLIPEKFRDVVDPLAEAEELAILEAYIKEAGIQVSGWLTSVQNIVRLLSPYTVGTIPYLRYLGALIGVEFSPEDEATEASLRKELQHAIDWYKLKGTYESIQILALIQQFQVNFYDMYTNDYVNFYMTEWFVGDEDENPPGFDSSYYKSPHFGLEIVLNKVFQEGSVAYLWRTSYLNNLAAQVEKTRPVHTVPHYLLLLNPKTDEFGHIIEVDGEIKTKIHGTWQVSTKHFDMIGSGEEWNFDDGTFFDQNAEAFINSISKWVFGTGGSFDIDNPAITGTVDSVTITNEKITFEFIVPKAEVQDGLNELGLYIPGAPDVLVLSSIFPKIDKGNNVELRVIVEVFKTDLAPEEPESGVSGPSGSGVGSSFLPSES
jgi:hypothetical protein